MKTLVYLESLGCAKNQVDSENLISLLESRGFACTNNPGEAALIIVNTCGFIEKAKRESIEISLELKTGFPGKKLIMVGCLAMRYGESLKKELPEIEIIEDSLYDQSFQKKLMNAILPQQPEQKRHSADGGFRSLYSRERKHLLSFPGSVYIKIADGCSNRCSYCAIPLIRGTLESRKQEDIIAEIRGFIGRGISEINLIAQDTASFGTDRGTRELAPLLRALASLNGDFWIRLLYLHPDHLDDEIIEAVRSSPKILPYFDIPFQHGNARILSAMNRKGCAESYARLIGTLRDKVPAAILRTTFLVGFPGETAEDFADLLDFQNEIRPSWAGVFTYSREESTPAYSLKPTVNKKTAEARKKILEERQTVITEAWLNGFIGTETDVLIEERVKEEDLALGRAWFQAPEVDGLVVVRGVVQADRKKVRARIQARSGVDLSAVLIDG